MESRACCTKVSDPIFSGHFRSRAKDQIRVIHPGPIVAVVDTGLNPKLVSANRCLPGINLSGYGPTEDTADQMGHGTKMATTVWSCCPEARILPIRVTDASGVLRAHRILVDALDWLCGQRQRLGPFLVCLGLADSSHQSSDEAFRDDPIKHCLATLRGADCMVVAAAGNWYPESRRRRGGDGMAWPAILREAVSVGDLDPDPGVWRLGATTQRLHSDQGTGCATTFFVRPGSPGASSGATAVLSGCLAAWRRRRGLDIDRCLEHVRGFVRPAAGAHDDPKKWPGLDSGALLAALD